MRYTPLVWPVNIYEMSEFKMKFNLYTPFVGYATRIRRGVNCQLKKRNISDLSEWGEYPYLRSIALKCSEEFRRYLKWKNAIFLPEDPFDIIVFDYLGGDGSAGAEAFIESMFNLPEEFDLHKFSIERAKYITVIQCIYDQIGKGNPSLNQI